MSLRLTDALKVALQRSLDYGLFSNATFLGERLFAEEKSDESRFLLASAYEGESKMKKAVEILKKSESPRNRFKLA